MCISVSLLSTPTHFLRNNTYSPGGPIVNMYVKQGLYMLWNWHGEKIDVVVTVTKSGEAGSFSNAEIQAFTLPTQEIGFPSPADKFCVLFLLSDGSGVGAVLQLL